MVTPVEKRRAVGHLCEEHGVSQRRACDVLHVDRSSVRYRSIRPDDADVRKAMKKVAPERRRIGYRRIHIMLERQGIHMNQKKLRRLYREEGLQVRKRGGRKRALGTRRPIVIPEPSISAGAWTSFQTPSRMGEGFAFSPLSMISAGSASLRSPTRRYRVRG